MEFFVVLIFSYSEWIRIFTWKISVFSPNIEKYGPQKTSSWVIFQQCCSTYHWIWVNSLSHTWLIILIRFITLKNNWMNPCVKTKGKCNESVNKEFKIIIIQANNETNSPYSCFLRFGILELRNRVTKPSYAKWRHTSSY